MFVVEITSFVRMPSDELKKVHREFLKKMLEQGELKLAGRMVDNTGSFLVWNTRDIEEAKSLASSDPYFANGLTTFVMKGWEIFWNGFMNPPVMPDK